jgi:hypothetical protein
MGMALRGVSRSSIETPRSRNRFRESSYNAPNILSFIICARLNLAAVNGRVTDAHGAAVIDSKITVLNLHQGPPRKSPTYARPEVP